MERLGNILVYLLFPLAGLLLIQTIPPDKFPLRFLILLVFCTLGVIAADSGARLASVRTVTRTLRVVWVRTHLQSARSAPLFMALALLFMVLCAQELLPSENFFFDFTVAIGIMIVGLIFLWLALHYAASPAGVATPTTQPLQPTHSNLLLALLGVLLLLAAGESAGRSLGIELLYRLPVPYEALLFYGGILLLVMGLGGAQGFPSPVSRLLRLLRPRSAWFAEHRRELVLVLLIFIGALGVRLWQINPGLLVSVDEAPALEGIAHYYGGRVGLVAAPSQYITTLLFSQWQGIVMNILGQSLTTIRLTAVIVGSLTVVVTYFLARDLFKDRLTGFMAALLLIVFPPHVHFSRLTHLHIADALFGTLTIWFLIRGIRWNRRVDWALAGTSLGLTQYFFEAGRLFYVPLVVGWLGAAVALVVLLAILRRTSRVPVVGRFTRWSNGVTPPHIPLKGVLITGLAFFLVAMPTYYSAFSLGGNVSPRLNVSGGFDIITAPFQDGLTGEEAIELVRRFLFPFTVYVHQPEIAVLYGGDQPMMLVYVVPFFLLGVGYLLWRWRTAASVILWWIVAAALSNALLRDSAVFARWHVVFPAVSIVVAVGLRCLLPVIWWRPADAGDDRLLRILRRLTPVVVVGLLVALMVGQFRYYFDWHKPLLERQARLSKPYPDVYDLALRTVSLPDSTDVYMIGDPVPDMNVPRAWIEVLSKGDPTTLRYFPMSAADFTTEYVRQLPLDRNLALFVDPLAGDAIALMRGRLGCDIQHSPYPVDPPEKEFLLCFVPMGSNRWNGL